MRARGTCARLNVRGLPSGAAAASRGAVAAPSSLHLDANESGTELARPLRLDGGACCMAG